MAVRANIKEVYIRLVVVSWHGELNQSQTFNHFGRLHPSSASGFKHFSPLL